jgi:hypothetical protein
VTNESSVCARNLLWVIDIDYSTRHHHGAMLRFRNYSRQLIGMGWRVYWLVRSQSGEFHREREYLEQLREQGVLTNFFECKYSAPRWRTRMATLSVLPVLGNRWLAPQHRALSAYCRELIHEFAIDVCVVSSRALLFLAPRLRNRLPVAIDFIDSYTLYRRRECRLLWENRDFFGLLRAARYLAESHLSERYYARSADASILVTGQTTRENNAEPAYNAAGRSNCGFQEVQADPQTADGVAYRIQRARVGEHWMDLGRYDVRPPCIPQRDHRTSFALPVDPVPRSWPIPPTWRPRSRAPVLAGRR